MQQTGAKVASTYAAPEEIILNQRYRITRELGRGGMATVYLAHDLRDDRDVAVKVLLPEVGLAVGGERFRREIAVATRFSHPRILPLYDSGEWNGQLFYVMPFIAGESLRAKLDRTGPLSIDEATRVAAEVADALDYAHAQGVVHRDIKPENILLDDGHALVMDFGIARAAVAAGEEKLTQTGLTLGTPHYMSPEQGMAERNIDGRSDIYSLGCVLYEMLAGQAPFAGTSAQALIARHALDQVPPLRIVRPTVPPELEATVLKSLAKVPADRFQSGHEMAEALRHPETVDVSLLARSTGMMTAAHLAAGQAAPVARSRRWFAVAGLVLAVLAVAGGYGVWRVRRNGSPAQGNGPDPRRIAVLFFEDLSPQHQFGYAADGLTTGLIDQLGAVRNLSVISRGGVEQFRGTSVHADSIARALQVGTIVRGTVESDAGRLQVSVQLVDAGSGAAFERASFEEPANRVLVLQDTLVAQVARMIRHRLGEEVQLRDQQQGTRNPDAWALVQRAEQRREDGERRMAANDTTGVLASFAGADSLLVQAHALDPAWPEPPTKRALIDYRTSRYFVDNPLRAAQWIDSGVVRANAALDLAPKDPTAFELRGTLRYWRYLLNIQPDGQKAEDSLTQAQSDLEQATKLNPAQAGAWAALSHLYAVREDPTDSKLAARRAYEEDAYLSNADLVLWRLFTTSYDLEQFPEAKHWCDIGATRFSTEPRFAECVLRLMATSALPADVPRTWRVVDSMITRAPAGEQAFRRAEGQVFAAAAIAKAGLADSARHILQRTSVSADVDPTRDITIDAAFAWTLVGDHEQAARAIKVYLTANPRQGSSLGSGTDWRFRALRQDPRYQSLFTSDKPGT